MTPEIVGDCLSDKLLVLDLQPERLQVSEAWKLPAQISAKILRTLSPTAQALNAYTQTQKPETLDPETLKTPNAKHETPKNKALKKH